MELVVVVDWWSCLMDYYFTLGWECKRVEASTYKSAKTHAGNVFVTPDIWPNNGVSRTHHGHL